MKGNLLKIIIFGIVFVLQTGISNVFGQDGKSSYTIAGKVTDEFTQESIPGATVMIKNTTLGAATDMDLLEQLTTSKHGCTIPTLVNMEIFGKMPP